jgi:hypothetical protein
MALNKLLFRYLLHSGAHARQRVVAAHVVWHAWTAVRRDVVMVLLLTHAVLFSAGHHVVYEKGAVHASRVVHRVGPLAVALVLMIHTLAQRAIQTVTVRLTIQLTLDTDC